MYLHIFTYLPHYSHIVIICFLTFNASDINGIRSYTEIVHSYAYTIQLSTQNKQVIIKYVAI